MQFWDEENFGAHTLTLRRWSVATRGNDIVIAEVAYSDAIINRKEIYDGKNGMTDRISMIKSYLAAFERGKQSRHYIDFVKVMK